MDSGYRTELIDVAGSNCLLRCHPESAAQKVFLFVAHRGDGSQKYFARTRIEGTELRHLPGMQAFIVTRPERST
jgi:hypothetical protein